MNEVIYNEDLINMAASAFLRDTAFYDAKDNLRQKNGLPKLKKSPIIQL